jgi:uncharacterized membrane protein
METSKSSKVELILRSKKESVFSKAGKIPPLVKSLLIRTESLPKTLIFFQEIGCPPLLKNFRMHLKKIRPILLILILFTAFPALAQDSAEGSPLWISQLFGRLHPMLVHFPIALILVAVVMELFTLKNFSHSFRSGIRCLVILGAISAVLSAGMGWLLAENEGITGSTLDRHRIIGMVSAGLSIFLLVLLRKSEGNPSSTTIKAYRSLLFLTGIGIGVAGHFGASLTHGEDYLTEVLPQQAYQEAPQSLTVDLSTFAAELSPEKEIQLVTNVRSVLAHNCYKCHSGAKIEGELRLDEKEFVFAGGENGPIVIPGDPAQSELIRRISLPSGHKKVMPEKGKLLSKEEIQLLTLWVEKGAPWPDGVAQQSVYRVAALAPRKPDLPPAKPGLENPIDLWVDQYFQQNQLAWSKPVDDRTFLRRASLDIVGLLPTPEELAAFQADPNPQKREIWIQKLLDRTDDYAQHWLTFWNDALRNDYTGTGYITRGRFAITDWLYTSIRDNKPYDQTRFPMIRCFHHHREQDFRVTDTGGDSVQGLTLNVSYAGNVFRAPLKWELGYKQ